MAAEKILKVIIAGDPKGALGAFSATEAGAGGLEGKLGKVGIAAAAVGTGIAAAAVGAGVALFKIGESFDEQYNKIRAGTGATGGDLDVLKDEFKKVVSDVPTDFGKAGDAVTEVTQKLGVSGDKAGGLAEQFLELSRITKTDLKGNLDAGTEALNNWNIATAQQPMYLDQMFRATQLTGTSFQAIATDTASFGAQLQGMGYEMGDAIALSAQLGQQGLSLTDIMPGMGKAAALAAKEHKSAGEEIQATFDKIKNAPDDVAAAGDALTVFGAKAGPKLADLIRQGKLDYAGLLATIQTGSDTIMGAGKDTQDFGDKWDLLKNRVLVQLEPIAMRVFDAVGHAMDKLGPIMTDLQPKFQQMSDWVQQHWPEIQATIEKAVTRVQAVITTVVEIVQALWANFGDNILAFVQQVWPAIQNIIEGAMTFIQGLVDTILAVIHGDWGAAWDGMKEMLSGAWQFMEGIVQETLAGIQLVVGAYLEVVGAIMSSAWGSIRDTASAAWGGISDVILGVFDGLKAGVVAAINWIIDRWNSIHIPEVDLGPVTIGGQEVPQISHVGGSGGSGYSTSRRAYADGGWVDAPAGMAVPATVHGGEFVLSRKMLASLNGSGGGAGVVFQAGAIVLHTDGSTHAAIAGQQIVDQIEAYFRNGGRPGGATLAALAG